MAPRVIDIRDLCIFDRKQIRNAEMELSNDKGFQREMKQRDISIDELFKTTYPLKYLGIELHNNGAALAKRRKVGATEAVVSRAPGSSEGETGGAAGGAMGGAA